MLSDSQFCVTKPKQNQASKVPSQSVKDLPLTTGTKKCRVKAKLFTNENLVDMIQVADGVDFFKMDSQPPVATRRRRSLSRPGYLPASKPFKRRIY